MAERLALHLHHAVQGRPMPTEKNDKRRIPFLSLGYDVLIVFVHVYCHWPLKVSLVSYDIIYRCLERNACFCPDLLHVGFPLYLSAFSFVAVAVSSRSVRIDLHRLFHDPHTMLRVLYVLFVS